MCVSLIRMCCFIGRTSVLQWRWGMGVDFVQPVAIRMAEFCVICNFSMCVSAVSGCYAMCAYESIFV